MSFNNGQAPTTWTEPPWCGWIETTGDALLILEAARRGLIPRVTRRLVDAERKMISSGSVFVFDEDESGIKRWTDGFFWSPSRILGNFLLYRETDKKTAGRGRGGSSAGGDRDSPEDEAGVLSRPKDGSHLGPDRQRERNLMGSLTNNPKFKSDGLMKKTFSLTIGGVAQHLISYYRVEDVENGRLRSPSSLPELASLAISPEYLDKTHFRNPPKVEIGPDGIPRYRGEADDAETGLGITRSPNPPMASGPPLLSEGAVNSGGKRPRYEPYAGAGPSSGKRPRKQRSTDEGDKTPSPVVPPLPAEVAYPAAPAPASAATVSTIPAGQSYPHPDAAPTQSQPVYAEPPAQSNTPPASSVPPPTSQVHPYYAYYPQPGYPPHPHVYPYHHPATAPPSTAPPASAPAATASSSSTSSPPPVTGGTPTPAVVPYPYDPNAPTQHQHQQQPFYYPYGYSYAAWPASYGYPAQPSTLTPAVGAEKAAAPADAVAASTASTTT